MSRNGVRFDSRQLRNNLNKFQGQAIERAKMGGQVIAAQNENRAKSERKWKDRTGQARASITGSMESDNEKVTIGLAIGADHGRWLETAMGGNYSIIWPTILEQQRELLELGRLALMGGRM